MATEIKSVWCALARCGEWCAIVPNEDQSDSDSVKTMCKRYITLPHGIEKRVPTCSICRKKVRKVQRPA